MAHRYRVHIDDGLFLVDDTSQVAAPGGGGGGATQPKRQLLFDTCKLSTNASGKGFCIHVFVDGASPTAQPAAEDQLYAGPHRVGLVS